MTTPIANTTAVSTNDYAAGTTTTSPPEHVSILPAPSADPLTAMVSSGDIGSAVAAFVMLNEKGNREIARAARDSAYASMESAQKDDLDEMSKAATTRLVTGLVEGSLELGSAGMTIASIQPGATASNDDVLARGMGAGPKQSQLLSESGAMKNAAGAWSGTAEGLKAFATIDGAVGKYVADNHDRAAKAAEQHADTFKRIASDHHDDMDEANKAIDKSMQFYQDWISSRNAAQAAAIHRS